MDNVATAITRSKGKFVCLDADGNEVAAGSPDAVTVRTTGFTLLQNGDFKVGTPFPHPNPPPPDRRRCKTKGGKLPEPAPEHLVDDAEQAAIAVVDAGRIEPRDDPPGWSELGDDARAHPEDFIWSKNPDGTVTAAPIGDDEGGAL
jgi:hypothetical protein